jgi:SAM-dependent methyltransferase
VSLYQEQAAIQRDQYLEAHSHNPAVIRRNTAIFARYSRFIPAEGAVLDWGCNHAPDSCLVKMLRGDSVQLYGCDVGGREYKAFHGFANLRFSEITHPYFLPYEDNFFDAVIGSAALEHVPNDSESLKEMYRILKPGGVLIITTLPNRLSYTEWLSRVLRRPHHLRRYSLKMMKSTGGLFDSPFMNRFAGMLASQNEIGERLWPILCFASNLFIVGRKVASMDNLDSCLVKI